MLAAVGEGAAALEEGRAGAFGTVGEILEILPVAHVRRADVQAPVPGEVGELGELHAAAARAVLPVVGQVVPVELAALVLGHLAEVAAEVDARLAVEDRLEGEVGVRCDVPVVGDRQLHAIGGGVADARKQEAALALVGERKAQPRQVHERHSHEVDARVAAAADLVLGVERNIAGLDVPTIIVQRAGSEHHALEVDLPGGRERQLLGGTARRALAQGELRVAKLRSGGGGVTAGATRDAHQRVLELDASVAAHRAAPGVVLDVVGADSPIALGRLDVALEGGVAIDTECRLIGCDVDRAETRGAAAGRSGAVSGRPGRVSGRSGGRAGRRGSCGGWRRGRRARRRADRRVL